MCWHEWFQPRHCHPRAVLIAFSQSPPPSPHNEGQGAEGHFGFLPSKQPGLGRFGLFYFFFSFFLPIKSQLPTSKADTV